MTIDATDRRLINATQSGLPLTPEPFAEIASWLGLTEDEVIDRLSAMQARGVIRRIALAPNHYALGVTANGMSVWDVADDQAETLGATPPGSLEALDLNELKVSAVGAELTGTGAVIFDNSAGMPKPLGAVDLQLIGGNGLIDKLVAMGFVPEDQAMGARMMLGLFAVPSGEDTLTSKIEFKEDGGVYANGQRVQ